MFKRLNRYIGIERNLIPLIRSTVLRKCLTPVVRVTDYLLSFSSANRALNTLGEKGSFSECCSHFKRILQFEFDGEEAFLERLPAQGPCIIIANHPTGFLETLGIPELIYRKRKDLKVLAQSFLDTMPFSKADLISVDIYSKKNQRQVLRQSGEWLKQSGVLLIFPAGEISNYSSITHQIKDKAWSNLPVWLANRYNAPIQHLHLQARNSLLFYGVSRLSASSRIVLICHELFNKKKKKYALSSSTPVSINSLGDLEQDELTRYFYHLNYALPSSHLFQNSGSIVTTEVHKHGLKLSCAASIYKEVNELANESIVYEMGSFSVYDVTASDIPQLLEYIQIAREVSFREVGMGTGNDKDGDDYDRRCRHLFIWDTKKNALVGSYRYSLVNTHSIESYISNLYSIDFDTLGRSGTMMECSRSFIVKAYQKSFKSLLCLWRGLAQVVLRDSSIRYLTGLVSIPAGKMDDSILNLVQRYTQKMSKQLPSISRCFSPRNPYQSNQIIASDVSLAVDQCQSVAQFENLVTQLSGATFSLPVLFKQYESIGLLPLKMSVDPDFSDCIDVLQVWDIAYHIPSKLKIFFKDDGLLQLKRRQQVFREQGQLNFDRLYTNEDVLLTH